MSNNPYSREIVLANFSPIKDLEDILGELMVEDYQTHPLSSSTIPLNKDFDIDEINKLLRGSLLRLYYAYRHWLINPDKYHLKTLTEYLQEFCQNEYMLLLFKETWKNSFILENMLNVREYYKASLYW